MPNYTVSIEDSPAVFHGMRAYTLRNPGDKMPLGYVGTIGGAVLAELIARGAGAGSSLTVIPAGWAYGQFVDPLPVVPDTNAVYEVVCIDPNQTAGNPWPTITAIAAEITP